MNKQFKLNVAAESGDAQEVKRLLDENVTVTPGAIYKAVRKRYVSVLSEILKARPELTETIKIECDKQNCLDFWADVQTVTRLRQSIEEYVHHGAFDSLNYSVNKNAWSINDKIEHQLYEIPPNTKFITANLETGLYDVFEPTKKVQNSQTVLEAVQDIYVGFIYNFSMCELKDVIYQGRIKS